MPDLIELLSNDHGEILALLHRLETEPHDTPEARLIINEVAQQLVIRESGHEAVEEMHLWPAVRDQVEGGNRLADFAIEQETLGKEALQALSRLTPGDAAFDETFKRVAKAIKEHVAFEQEQVWPEVTGAIGRAQRKRLGDKAAHDERHAPTRPHPSTPADPKVLGTAGRLTALVDRAADAVTGRGRPNRQLEEDPSAISRDTTGQAWEQRKDR